MWVEVSDPEGTGVVGDNVCASSRAPCAWVAAAWLVQSSLGSVCCVLSACLIRPLGWRTGGSPASVRKVCGLWLSS